MLQSNFTSGLVHHEINRGTSLFIILISVLISVLLINYLLLGIAAVIISSLVYLYGERFLIGLIIVTLLSVVSDFGPDIRLLVQLIDFSLLGFLFIKKYGIDFTSYPKLPKSIIYFILFYYFSMIIATIFSDYFFAGMEKIIRQSVFFIVAYIFYSFIKKLEDIKVYLIALIVVSLILAVSSIYKLFSAGFNLFDFELGKRFVVSSIISNVDTTSAFFILTLPLVLIFTVSKKYKNIRPQLISIAVILILGTFLAMSRSAILAMAFSLLFIFFYLRKDWFIKVIIYSIIAIGVIILFEPLFEFAKVVFRLEFGMSQRNHLWNLAVNIINVNPILGIGPGAYRYVEFNYFPVLLNSWVGHYLTDLNLATGGANNSHNLLLKFATDMGIPGIISVFYLLIVFFNIAIQTIKKAVNGRQELYLVVLALSAALGSMFIRNIFDSIGILTYGYLTNDLPFWLLFGVLIFFYQKPKEYFATESP